MNTRTYVAGSGVICSIGNTYDECFDSLKESRHGLRNLSLVESAYRGRISVGEVPQSNADLARRIGLSRPVTRTAMLAVSAIREALQRSGIKKQARWRMGLVSGTTVGGMDRTEVFFPQFLKDPQAGDLADVRYHGCGATTDLIASLVGIHDFTTTINTACSSSANAIALGARLIRHKWLDVVVAGGTDALTQFTVNGFSSLMILDHAPCRPFDAERKGLNLGEGAGYVVLVSADVMEKEGLTPKATLSGWANTSDAFHQTALSPEGGGPGTAMQQTLEMAGVSPGDVGYINLHGTGTGNNDETEAKAVKKIFGDRHPPGSSTKSYTGHTLGACGGIEAVFSVMALENQCLFPNLRFQNPMADLSFIPQTSFGSGQLHHVMSNSFGFGGNCSSLLFSIPS